MKKSEITKEQQDLINSHSGSISRRQFVGMGLVSATSVLFAPNVMGMISRAHEAKFLGAQSRVAFLAFDLAGGAGMPGNFLVGNVGGPEDLLKSYDTLGWNPKVDGWDSRFGLPMAKANISKIFDGMTKAMSPEAQARFKMGSISHVSRDDTSDNPLSVVELVSSVPGVGGHKIVKGLGMSTSSSGGNSRGVKAITEFSPLKVGSLEDVRKIRGTTATLDGLGEAPLSNVLKTMKRLSSGQVKKILGAGVESEAVNNGYKGLDSLLSASSSLDPRFITDTQAVYGLNANTPVTNVEAVRASIVNAVLNQVTGPGVITIGGCDYHTGNQTAGDAKDLEIGQTIGRAIELAHRRKIPLFIHIYSDGGVGATTGTRNWSSDNGEKSLSVIGFYDPAGAPKYRSASSMQIGHYTNGQGVNRDTLVGSSPSLASLAVFANYLNVIGKVQDFGEYIPNPFGRDGLESILVFE